MPRNISHPANREVLLYLLLNRLVYRQSYEAEAAFEPLFYEDDEIELKDLRTHPDLGGYLWAAASGLSGVKHGYVLGYNVLVNAADIVFAIAMSMNYMAFRLNPPDPSVQIAFDETKKIENLSREWGNFSVFGSDWSISEVEACCRKALIRANQISEKGSGPG